MHSHSNARLTQRGRLRLVIQHLEEGRSLSELAAQSGTASAAPIAGWLVNVLAVWPLWWIDGVFAAPSGGRSIRCSCSTP